MVEALNVKLKNAQYYKHTQLVCSSTHTDEEKKGRAVDTLTYLWFLIVTLITNEVSSGFNLWVVLWAGVRPCWEGDD